MDPEPCSAVLDYTTEDGSLLMAPRVMKKVSPKGKGLGASPSHALWDFTPIQWFPVPCLKHSRHEVSWVGLLHQDALLQMINYEMAVPPHPPPTQRPRLTADSIPLDLTPLHSSKFQDYQCDA